MAQEDFNVSFPNDGLGDKLRAAFIKVQANFTDLFTNKVDKEIGKGLSAENYTTTEKNKLANIQEFAQVNVQSDMAQNDETADDFIKNKLSIFGLATTQIINVGSIGSAEIQDVVNLDNGYVIQGQELGIRLVTSNDNGVAKNYLFLAPGGTYGIDLLQTVAADFQIFGNANGGVVINDNTPSLTEVYSSAKVEDELNSKADKATGLSQGGLLTINTDAAKFDLSAGFGYVVNGHSDPDNTTYTKVTWTAKIANEIPNLATQKQTYVSLDINGDLFFTNVPLTATQRRNFIRIGVLIHLNNSAVTYIDNQPTINIEMGGQVQDILEALGFRSLSGNRIFPVSTNLKIKKELGRVFKPGANFNNLTTQPHSFTLAAQENITFRYRTQTGSEGADLTDITPAIYDLNGTITPVAATATLATIQRVYIFQDGAIRIQPGQRVFTSLNSAITALNSDVFITDLDIAENGLYLGAIVLTRNTIDLSNISQAIFAPSIGTTANGSVASPALGYAAEDVTNKQNSLAVDGTAAKYPTVDAVNAGLILKQNIPRLVNANTTALNNEIFHVTADATIADIVGAVAGNVYKVVVINGLATIGGQIYGKGETIKRYFDGTIYITTLPNGQKYIDVTANATVTNDWYLAIVRIKATSTITIPSGLNRRIAFTCFAYPTITATFVAGAGETVTSAKGLVLKNGTTNSVFSDGLNAVIIIGEMTIL